jgi:hypothetical protein
MATVQALGGGQQPNQGSLCAAQTFGGSAMSTNVVDRGGAAHRPASLKIVTTIGGTPTVTVLIEVSPDVAAWHPAVYADSAAPTTLSFATFVITTAATFFKLLGADQPWRYLRLNMTLNTNVTITADLFTF